MYVKREKWLFLAKIFQFLAHFRQLLWRNRLDIARYITTSGRLSYSIGQIVLACNAKEELCVQNESFGLVFVIFLEPVWPCDLEIARCKISVDMLSYGIGIDLLKRGS